MDSSCLVIVSILEGRNFELPEECELTGDQYHLLIEAKFNDEVLWSDPITLQTSSPALSPEIYTELAWQLTRRSLHQFRIDRKPIKLQCFLVRTATNEKSFIGYLVIDLRTAQESEVPKHEWKPLLNTKYRGHKTHRPEIQIALHVTKCPDDDEEEISEIPKISPEVVANGNGSPKRSRQEVSRNGTEPKKVVEVDDYEYDIEVREIDGWFRIWDSRRSPSSSCMHYNLSVVIVSAEDIYSLINPASDHHVRYHFKFSLLGKTIRTKSFEVASIPGPVELPVEKITFKVAPSDFDLLKKYFELNGSFEILFCSEHSTIASVTIPLANLYINSNGPSPVVGEFNLNPTTTDDQDIHDNKAVIGVYVALEKITQGTDQDVSKDKPIAITLSSDSSLSSSSLTSPERNLINRSSKLKNGVSKDTNEKVSSSIKNGSSENKSSTSKDIPHQYCLSIDIRNIRSVNAAFNWSKSSFLIQYSYAFFGPTTKIKTSSVNVVNDEIINFENGFFTFNFMTSESQLRETFENIALILELIEVSNKAIIRGISHINLLDLIESEESDKRKLLVTKPIITDYNDENIAQVTVIFSLQDMGLYQNGNHKPSGTHRLVGNYSETNSDSDSLQLGHLNVNSTSIMEAATGKSGNLNQVQMNNSIFNQIDHLFIEAALEIEAWKQAQVKLFRETMKKKEKKMTERKIQELSALKIQLNESLRKVALKEQLLDEMRSKLESEVGKRTAEEIAKVRHELESLKLVIEEKCGKIEKLELQNQQLKSKLLTGDRPTSSSLSSRTSSVSRATGSKLRESLISENRENVNLKKKSDPKDFVLRSSAGFTRDNSLPPSSVRPSSIKLGRTISNVSSKVDDKIRVTKEQKPFAPKTPSRTPSTLSTGSVRWKSSATTPSASSCVRSSLVQNGRTAKPVFNEKERKSQLLEQLKAERNTMIKSGLCRSDDPMIKNIEKELRRHGVKSTN